MALITADRVKETTTVVGTGTITLLGAQTGFQSFATIGTGNTCYYAIASVDSTYWETGIGTYTLSGTTLTRTTVLTSSNAGALVSFIAGVKEVFVTYPASKSVFTDSVGCVNTAGASPYPTIRPSLNLDFANSKQLDPRITFNRNTTATYYDGKTTAKAEENLLKGSNDFGTVATWVSGSGTVGTGITAPDGTISAYSFTATGVATLYQTLTTSALPYTLTLYIQRVTGTGTVNLTLDGTTLTAQTITASWARYTLTVTPTATSHTIGLQLAISGDVVNIWGAQLEQRSQATAYTPTTTAPITNYIPQLMTAPAGVARFDHDPISGKSLGLLIEESRTNLQPKSQDISVWPSKSNCVITTDIVISPDGSQTADLFIPTAIAAQHYVYDYGGATLANTTYTFSVYIKPNGLSKLGIGFVYNSHGTNYDLSTLTAVTNGGTPSIISTDLTRCIIPVGNGWYRLIMTGTPTSSSPVLIQSDSLGTTLAGDDVSGFYIWGAQLEAGSFATSYIPTTSGTVSRAADQASMTGTNFSSWYNQSEGSFYSEFDSFCPVATPASYSAFAISGNNSSNFNRIGIYNSSYKNTNTANGVSQVEQSLSGHTPNTTVKIISNFPDGALLSWSKNGVLAVSTTSILRPSVNRLDIGSHTGQKYLSGHIRKLAYYPKALSSTELQGLTQP